MKTFLHIDALNSGLILLSLLLAYWLPFELFLLAYAILGPLHYFTEINWIRDKNYFVSSKLWIYIVLASALLISIPPFIRVFISENYQQDGILHIIGYILPPYLNACLFFAIVSAVAFTVFKRKRYQYMTIIVGVIVAILFHFLPIYHLIVGILLPTLIHVYIFTILFMWYGNLKSNSKIGYFNIVLMILVPFIIAYLVDFSIENIAVGKQTGVIYQENSFHLININVSELLGLSDGTPFSFFNILSIKIQMFISFAYTYHYLNWFSKTTIIGWHTQLTKKRSLIITILWIASVSLYFYNYRIGLTLLLFLSFLHVFMEFPLNVISVKAIGKSIFNPNKS